MSDIPISEPSEQGQPEGQAQAQAEPQGASRMRLCFEGDDTTTLDG